MARTVWLALAVMCCIGGVGTHAQEFPSSLIKLVVSSAPGGGTDILGRLIADKWRKRWGRTVVVENRVGVAGNIAAEDVFLASPNGYTLLITAQMPLVLNESLYSKLNFQPEKFVPVSLVASTPTILLVNPQVPVKNVSELVALAKKNPGKLNYASQGVGSTAHLTAALFTHLSGTDIVHVPYKGTAPALLALISGETQMMFGELATAAPYIQSGKLKALAVGSEERTSLLPELPTVAEILPGFVSITWWGIVAPPATPPAIANVLAEGVTDALSQPDVRAHLDAMGLESIGGPPARLQSFVLKERDHWGRIVRMTDIHVQ